MWRMYARSDRRPCNPGAWRGTSVTAPGTAVACANDAEVFEGLLGAQELHELVFGGQMCVTSLNLNPPDGLPT
jgi:hypothetical protein